MPTPPTPVRRHPLASQAADALLERVRAGEWPLGHRLPGETTLAVQLGVGRSTVREAIRELAGKGVLDSRQGSGVFVTSLDVVEDWDVVLRRASIVAVLEARVAIESEAAALAALRRTPDDLRTVRRALAQRAAAPDDDPETLVDVDTAFHRAVVAAAHNEVLLELFDSFVPRVRTAMVDMLRLRTTSSPHDDQSAHTEIVEAVAARDAGGAARSSRTHVTSLVAVLS